MAYYAKVRLLGGGNAWQKDTVAQMGLLAVFFKMTVYTAYWPSVNKEYIPVIGSTTLFWFYTVYSVTLAALLGFITFSRDRIRLFPCLCWFYIPISILLVFSLAVMPLWVDRYSSYLAPYLIVLLSAALVQLWEYRRPAAVVMAAAYSFAVAGALIRFYTVTDRPDYRSAFQYLKPELRPGDVVAGNGCYEVVTYYNGGPLDGVVLEVPSRTDPNTHDMSMTREEGAGIVEKLPIDEKRLWVLFVHSYSAQPTAMLQTAIVERFAIDDHHRFDGIDLYLLTPRQAMKKASSVHGG
jgi:hypothetical protein